ncbi:LPXTG cell wall anchor domain-containing protein [Enterococcus faecium]|uniref:LPXTG cell wall anchor domain-containing protein n=1 Tax=Enterococcus faecium TaxID=1352 RepID=UPI00313445B1
MIRFILYHWKSSTNQKQIRRIMEKRQFRCRQMVHQMKKNGGSFPKTSEEMLGGFSILGLLLVLSTGTAWFYKKQQKGNNRREIK